MILHTNCCLEMTRRCCGIASVSRIKKSSLNHQQTSSDLNCYVRIICRLTDRENSLRISERPKQKISQKKIAAFKGKPLRIFSGRWISLRTAQHVRHRFFDEKHVKFILMGNTLHTYYIKETTHFRTRFFFCQSLVFPFVELVCSMRSPSSIDSVQGFFIIFNGCSCMEWNMQFKENRDVQCACLSCW